MPHNIKLKNFSHHVVDLQHAKENGTLRVTTEEAGAVIARYVPNERIILYYNLYAETVHVLVHDSAKGLTPVAKHETNQPITLAASLCEKYPKA